MEHAPGISILTPIYNGIEFLDSCIKTVKSQTYSNWEMIIGINGHLPGSEVFKKAMAYQSDKIRVLELYPIRGKSDALNKMLEYCTYDYVAILDVDDLWLPQKLSRQSEFLVEYDVVGTHTQYFGSGCGIPKIPLGDLSDHDFLARNPIINSSVILKKSLAHWTNEYYGVEDYELWLKLWKQGKKFYNVSEVLTKHQLHKSSSFNGNSRQREARKRLVSDYQRPRIE